MGIRRIGGGGIAGQGISGLEVGARSAGPRGMHLLNQVQQAVLQVSGERP